MFTPIHPCRLSMRSYEEFESETLRLRCQPMYTILQELLYGSLGREV